MAITNQRFTAEQLIAMPDDGKRHELVKGELRTMLPPGNRHGRVAMRIGSLLEQHVRKNQLGEVFAAETGFLLSRNPDTVRAPDAAFVSRARFEPFAETVAYLPLAPDLVVEVVSPSDTYSEVDEKAQFWLDAGTRMVLVVDPEARTIRVYRTSNHITLLDDGQQLDAGDVVIGWKFNVRELFEWYPRK